MSDGREPAGRRHAAANLLMCERIDMDPVTGKASLWDVFETLDAQAFPLFVPSMAAYVSLRECRDRMAVALRIVDAEEQRPPVHESNIHIEAPDSAGNVEHAFHFHMGGLVFPEPGEYRVQVRLSGHTVIEHRLSVLLLPPNQPAPPTPESDITDPDIIVEAVDASERTLGTWWTGLALSASAASWMDPTEAGDPSSGWTRGHISGSGSSIGFHTP